MRIRIVGAAALTLLLASSAAWARDIPAGGLTVNDVVAWLQGAGYSAQVITGSDGKVHVKSAAGGVNFGVYMFDCKDDRCGSLQFSAGFATHGKFDVAQMNAWNRDSRWARGYYDKVNDPWVEMDVDLDPGGTYELLNDELTTWNRTLARFVTTYSLQ